MTEPLSVVVFDVNETLSDLSPMAERFAEIGAPPHFARVWFASLLRDGFAATAAGHSEPFAVIGREVLRGLLAPLGRVADTEQAIDHIMGAFVALPLHPDVPAGVRALREARFRLVTLTNGATRIPEQLLTRAGLEGYFERFLSVEDAGVWKPAAASYAYAATACDVALEHMVLVASHPWDIDGASRAGMRTAWIDRAGGAYPGYFAQPDYTATGIDDLAGQLQRAG